MGRESKWKQRPERYRRETPLNSRKGSYIWRVPPEYASRTRSDHLALDGQMFTWDDPPVHNRATGARGHPGIDPHCRCYAEEIKPKRKEG